MTAVACRLCKAPLYRKADPVADEHGHQFGHDQDVADLKPAACTWARAARGSPPRPGRSRSTGSCGGVRLAVQS